MKTNWYYSILILFLFLINGPVSSQNPISPYPIIFVHGLSSAEGAWDSTINFLKQNYSDKQIFHAVLNAYSGVRSLEGPDGQLGTNDDDVLFPTMDSNGNAVNQLHNGSLFVINFRNFWDKNPNDPKILTYSDEVPGDNESKGNESAIYKQGYALSVCIKAVLLATDAEKVILVGWSMGGLTIREYLQRKDNNGKHIWWKDQNDPINGHKVAKVVTIGTPHLGCNYAVLVNHSEAGRDLAYSYATTAPSPYLFSNLENNIPGEYGNYDVNCNGTQTDWIDGINYNTSYSLLLPLPYNISYTWITSKFLNLQQDGVVDLARQFLYETNGDISPVGVSDTLLTNKFHTDEPSDYYSIIRGLDEPDDTSLAYQIGGNSKIAGFITYQTNYFNIDRDLYKIILTNDGYLSINIDGYLQSGIGSIELLNNKDSILFHLGTTDLILGLTYHTLPGIYYVRVRGIAQSNSYFYQYPYPYTLTTSYAELKVVRPNGGEAYPSGMSLIVQWSSNNIDNVKIEYSTNGGTDWSTIVESTPANANSYNWTLPNTPYADCKIRISDALNSLNYDVSDNSFAITQLQTLHLQSPIGGENYPAGSNATIQWTSNAIDSVKLEYSTNGGTDWNSIIASTPSSPGSYIWTVPNTPSANCKIRISDVNSTMNDKSDGVFSIIVSEPLEIITAVPIDITSTTATSGGNVTSNGAAPMTARGVCWSVSQNPTTANSKTNDGTGTGSFTSSLIELAANTTYYVRAYATNSAGTAYGNQVNFTTKSGGTTGTVTDIDGNVYQTVTIGTQVWMVENLKTTKYRNGDLIGTTTPATLDIYITQ